MPAGMSATMHSSTTCNQHLYSSSNCERRQHPHRDLSPIHLHSPASLIPREHKNLKSTSRPVAMQQGVRISFASRSPLAQNITPLQRARELLITVAFSRTACIPPSQNSGALHTGARQQQQFRALTTCRLYMYMNSCTKRCVCTKVSVKASSPSRQPIRQVQLHPLRPARPGSPGPVQAGGGGVCRQEPRT